MTQPIRFTPHERDLIQDNQFFKTKVIITQKVKELLHKLQVALKEDLVSSDLLMPEGADTQIGQFVKGEHLLGFPYLYLDFPKYFTKTDKFTFRTLFWWGHYFVFAWILEGTYLDQYKKNILSVYDRLADQGLYLLMTETPWEWRKGSDYLLEIRTDNQKEVTTALESRHFLKIHSFIDFHSPQLIQCDIVEEGRKAFRAMKPIVLA